MTVEKAATVSYMDMKNKSCAIFMVDICSK